MADIKPFNAFFYNKRIIEDLGNVITQPYDEITQEMEEEYRRRSPYSIVRIIKGDFREAGRLLDDWIEKGIFVQDKKPCIYAYDRVYSLDGERKVQGGFIALGKLSPYSINGVRPHEKTFLEPIRVKFNLLKSTNAHFGQVFMLYRDERMLAESLFETFKQNSPVIEVEDWYGNIHKVWRISDEKVISQVQQLMIEKPLLIADGHHRYEAALQYAKSKNFFALQSYRMMTFVNVSNEKNITILPAYRLVETNHKKGFFIKRLSVFFNLWKRPIEDVKNNFYPAEFGFYFGGNYYFAMKMKDRKILETLLKELPPFYRNLNAVVLHEFIFPILKINKPVSYEGNLERAIKEVDESKKVLFIMKPASIREIEHVAENGVLMPQKSTNFYPKLLTGLAIHRIEMLQKEPYGKKKILFDRENCS